MALRGTIDVHQQYIAMLTLWSSEDKVTRRAMGNCSARLMGLLHFQQNEMNER